MEQVIAALALLGAASPAQAMSETAESFARAMQGCWNRADTADGLSNQLCLDGGLTGTLTVVECQSHGDLTECATQDGSYQFDDENFWRRYGENGWLTGGVDNCDVRFGPGAQFTLHHCQWTTEPQSGLTSIEDAVYDKAGEP